MIEVTRTQVGNIAHPTYDGDRKLIEVSKMVIAIQFGNRNPYTGKKHLNSLLFDVFCILKQN